jgi:hypothetical protein
MLSKDSTTYYPRRQLTRGHPRGRNRSRSHASALWEALSRRLSPDPPRRARHTPPGIFTGDSPITSAPTCHPPGVGRADGHQTHSRRRGGVDRDGPSVSLMAIRPATLWGLLPQDVKQAIVADLNTIVSEVINVYDGSCSTPSSQSQSRDLPAIPAYSLVTSSSHVNNMIC